MARKQLIEMINRLKRLSIFNIWELCSLQMANISARTEEEERKTREEVIVQGGGRSQTVGTFRG